MKIKTKRALAAILVLIMAFYLAACGALETDDEGTVKNMDAETNIKTIENMDDEKSTNLPVKRKEVAVSEMYSEKGSVSVPGGLEYEYSFHVPQIEDDTPGAVSINEEISQLYGIMADDNLECINNKELPWCNLISYESYCSGDVLSLVVSCTNYYDYISEYNTYNYDTAKGVRLTNADVLKMKGMTEEQYLDAVRRAAAQCYDNQTSPIREELDAVESPWAYQERRIWTISARNITMDMPLYLDDDGVIHTVAAIGCHAGADSMPQTLTPDLEDGTADVEINDSLDFMTVTRRGGALTICFHKTAQSTEILEQQEYLDVPYEEDLPVHGLYGNYTRIFCGMVGEMNWPYVFLLTEEGRVEYIDVTKCLMCGYLCAGGPLPGVEDVKDFTTGTDENGLQWVYAITGSGERIELQDLTVLDQFSMNGCFVGDWSYSDVIAMDSEGPRGGFYNLSVSDYSDLDLIIYRSNSGEDMEADGYLTYLGMTEDGAVCEYQLWGSGSNGPGLVGAVALEMWTDMNGSVLTITELGGTPLLGDQTGDTTTLARSFG